MACALTQGDILSAESLAREALAISRSAFGRCDVTVASHLSFLGMLLKEKVRFLLLEVCIIPKLILRITLTHRVTLTTLTEQGCY